MPDPVEPPTTPDYDVVWEEVYGDMQHHGPVHRHLARLLRKELGRLDYRSVLEVGCGPGHNFPLLTEGRQIDRLGGVDISEVALARARASHAGDFRVADIQQEPLHGSWDLVVCSLVLEHLTDDVQALRNMRPAVGGSLLLTTIAGDFERYRAWDERMGHVRNYRRGELEEKVERSGFRVTGATYWGWPFYSPIVRTVQNRSAVGTGSFNAATRAIATMTYLAYFLNSRRRGDLLVLTAEPA